VDTGDQQCREDRDGAWVTELSDQIDLSAWPEGSRLICRSERPHPGAQFTIFDEHGYRYTCFLTDQEGNDTAELELRHRGRARVEDSIGAGKDTGIRDLPHHAFEHNQTWLETSLIAQDLLCWKKPICLHGESLPPNPSAYVIGCCTPPARSSTTAAAPDSRSNPTGHGRPRSWPRSHDCARSRRSAERPPPPHGAIPTASQPHTNARPPTRKPIPAPRTSDPTAADRPFQHHPQPSPGQTHPARARHGHHRGDNGASRLALINTNRATSDEEGDRSAQAAEMADDCRSISIC
jgi:hypothetical protein